jgi:FtsP/CotA-like multicopper oxidase with cupredoxin domain
MIVQPIDWFLLAWFAVAVCCAAYVAYDQFNGNPEPAVMKWGFVLVTLYMGPLGLLLYVMADKEPQPGTHEAFVAPLWKQSVGSTIHCCAGDATGIIVAAAITATLGLPMWVDYIVEYVAGFSFGLFIFQALFMRGMMGGTYLENVRRSFTPELISMNAMMAAMMVVMTRLMMGRDMRAMQPTELLFWGVMSLGVIAGFGLAYPFNAWLVAKGLKHGLMTERTAAAREKISTRASRRASAKGQRKPEGHAGHSMPGMAHDAQHQDHGAGAVTRAQLVTVTIFATVLLAIGAAFPALHTNMSLSAHDVGASIMPPGMIMANDTPAAAMRDMAAILPREVRFVAPVDAVGDRPLEPRVEGDVKVFDLETSVIEWHILPTVSVLAYAFNRQVPGPRLHLVEGDRVRINVHNNLPEPTTVHWHGLNVPNAMDGAAEITQKPIPPGSTYTYEYTAEQSGTYLYHTHAHIDRQQSLGLYGALIIDPKLSDARAKVDVDYVIQLQEWLQREGLTYPAMPMEGALPNYFTINGKAYPSTETIHLKVGQTVKVRFIGSNNIFIHPMHIHGGPFTVIARDGVTLAPDARFEADTVNVGPGQRYDVVWRALRPGKWLIHCHIGHHTTNNNAETAGGGGLMMIIDVTA